MVPSCAEGGVLGVLCASIGSIQVNEAIKLITGIGDPLVGRLTIYDALEMSYRQVKVKKDPECPLCGKNPTITDLLDDYEAFCGVVSDEAAQAASGSTITAGELKEMLDRDDDIFLVDVREPNEFEIVSIPNATLIPKGEFLSGAALERLPQDRQIVLHCKSGARSAECLAVVHNAGFSDAVPILLHRSLSIHRYLSADLYRDICPLTFRKALPRAVATSPPRLQRGGDVVYMPGRDMSRFTAYGKVRYASVVHADAPGSYLAPPSAPPRRHTRQLIAGIGALVSAAIAIAAAVQLIGELTSPPTQAERDAAATRAVARRWQAWPAGKIFPATLPYALDIGGPEKARRVGIDPGGSGCTTAVDPTLIGTLRGYGCRGALRATYLDQLQGLAITVGVVAFPDERSAALARKQLPKAPGLRTLALPGSVVARFTDAARQSAAALQQGPYVALAAIGYADGRPAAKAKQGQVDLYTIAPQLAQAVLTPLAARPAVDCAQKAVWAC
jgi:rhodanese-related sulfurtransferase